MDSAPQVIQISQAGKVVGNKLTVGELSMVRGKLTIKLTKKTISLGDGVELVGVAPMKAGNILINVTAEAAARHGWPHPANKPQRTQADIDRLMPAASNPANGEQEQIAARLEIRAIAAEIAQRTGEPVIEYRWHDYLEAMGG